MNTQKHFINAFYTLTTSNSFQDISVEMILHEADLSRKTFYKYYSNKQDWLYQCFLDILKNIHPNCSAQNLSICIKNYFSTLLKNYDYCNLQEDSIIDNELLKLMIKIVTQTYLRYHKLPSISSIKQYEIEYKCAATFCLLHSWNKNNDFSELDSVINDFIEFFLQ